MSVNKQTITSNKTYEVSARKTKTQPISRLELYNSLFGQQKNKNKHDETGLQSQQSLNYSLYTFLHLSDINWVLAMIDIADFDTFDGKYGYQLKHRKIWQVDGRMFS